MSMSKDHRLSEYSNEESARIRGALSSMEAARAEEGTFRLHLSSREYLLCDFSMYAEELDGAEAADEGAFDGNGEQITGEELLFKAFSESERAPASEEYSMCCDAAVTQDESGRTVIVYNESLDGETEQSCEISFDPALPELVTVCKSGMANMVMTLEVGKRHGCLYRTPFMDFELRVRAMRVDNTVSEKGGRLRLDYALEIRGAAAHRTVMEIELIPAE